MIRATLHAPGHLDVTGRFRRFTHVCVEDCAIKAWIQRPKRKYTRRQRGNEAKVVVGLKPEFETVPDVAGNDDEHMTTRSEGGNSMAPADFIPSPDPRKEAR